MTNTFQFVVYISTSIHTKNRPSAIQTRRMRCDRQSDGMIDYPNWRQAP